MQALARRILRGAVLLIACAMCSFVGSIIGQELRGSPAAPFVLALGLMALAGAWWSLYRTKRRLAAAPGHATEHLHAPTGTDSPKPSTRAPDPPIRERRDD